MASRSSDSISLRTMRAVDVEASECDGHFRDHHNDGASDEDDDEPLPDEFKHQGSTVVASTSFIRGPIRSSREVEKVTGSQIFGYRRLSMDSI